MGQSDFLFVMPSFRNGVARTIDLFGDFTEYNVSENGEKADTRALYHDAAAVFQDLREAVRQFQEQR